MKKHKQWKKERYEQIVTVLYDGYTNTGAAEKLGVYEGAISYGLHAIKLSSSKIRAAKKSGMPLATLLDGIDWAFLEERKIMRKERAHKALAARGINRIPPKDELSELLSMVRDLHAMWCDKPIVSNGQSDLKGLARAVLARTN